MKKILIAPALLVAPFFCFGMQEPAGSSSDSRAYAAAAADKNIPLLYALTAASKNNDTNGDALTSLSSLPESPDNRRLPYHHPELPIELYKDLASYLCPTCNERGMAHALNVATHASSEKTQFLLQKFSQKLQPHILEEVVRNFFTNNPLFIPLYKTENEKNAATFQALINAGAELSPENASLALQTLMRNRPAHIKIFEHENLMYCLNIAALECCYPERRLLMHLLKQKGAHFNGCTGDESCGAYCDGLFARTHTVQIRDVDAYLGKQLCTDDNPQLLACMLCTLCSIVFAPCLVRTYCMPLNACCCLIGAAQCVPDSQASHMYKTALQKIQHAVPMDPANLGQNA